MESTGASSEFYDKFSIRHHISVIVKELWKDRHHKDAILEHSKSNEFVRFVNMLINDTTFLLDEALNCLKSINEIQLLMKNRPEWEALTRVSVCLDLEWIHYFTIRPAGFPYPLAIVREL